MPWTEYLRFAAALIFVLALIGGLGWLARRFGPGALMRPTPTLRRLAVLESQPLDSRRRLVLVRRDGTDHLLLLSQHGDRIVETGIAPPPEPEPDRAAGAETGAAADAPAGTALEHREAAR